MYSLTYLLTYLLTGLLPHLDPPRRARAPVELVGHLAQRARLVRVGSGLGSGLGLGLGLGQPLAQRARVHS